MLSVAFCGYTQLFAVQPSGVVDSELTSHRFDFVESNTPWLSSMNPAGLGDFRLKSMSFGSLSFEKESGELANYFESNNSSEYKVGSKSLYRFNNKVIVKGEVSYTNFSGENMSGSVFINPYDRPFDILDFDSSNQGVKNIEFYTINGAVSVELFRGLELGAELDFNSASYAKMKDLRYKTSYSKLNATTAVRYSPLKNLHLGVARSFTQEIEGVNFSFYGPENILYRELISFGGFWGISSTYSSLSHNFIKNTRQPYIEYSNNISAQISYKFADLTLMIEGYQIYSNGYYGLESNSSVVHTKNKNIEQGINAQLLYSSAKSSHTAIFKFSNFDISNNRTVWRDQSTGGGSSEVVYFDAVKAGEIGQKSYSLEYRGYLGITNMTPRWQVEAGYSRYERDVFATIYPFYREQTIHTSSADAMLLRNISWRANTIAIALGGAYQWGGGVMSNDGTYATPSSEMVKPKTSDEMMRREWDFLTAKQYGVSPMVRYSRLLNKNTEIYTTLNYTFTSAYELHDRSRSLLSLSVGCNF